MNLIYIYKTELFRSVCLFVWGTLSAKTIEPSDLKLSILMYFYTLYCLAEPFLSFRVSLHDNLTKCVRFCTFFAFLLHFCDFTNWIHKSTEWTEETERFVWYKHHLSLTCHCQNSPAIKSLDLIDEKLCTTFSKMSNFSPCSVHFGSEEREALT